MVKADAMPPMVEDCEKTLGYAHAIVKNDKKYLGGGLKHGVCLLYTSTSGRFDFQVDEHIFSRAEVC